MRTLCPTLSMISLLMLSLLSTPPTIAETKDTLDLLALPSKQSALASKSIMIAMRQINNSVIVVGERGHIINWQNNNNWQQQQSPVSVAITDITILSDGSKIAVGHDGVILKVDSNSSTWRKVFTGKKITQFKIAQLQQQYQSLEQVILSIQDEDELEELTYQLDDLAFAIEDNQLELKSGPNKPLLSVTSTSNDSLFATGAYGILLRSEDKGETWQLLSNRLENPDSYHLNSVITTADDQLYIVGENGTGFHSSDVGQTWSVMTLPYSGSLFGILANPVKPASTSIYSSENLNSTKNTNQLVAFGLQGNVMVSLDDGKHWQHTKLPSNTSLLGGAFSKQGKVYLVGHGGIMVSFNPEDLSSMAIKKHPSGAALSSILIQDNSLIIAGQFGISQWPIKEKE